VFLEALEGPRYPEPPSSTEWIQAWEKAVRQVPDDPDSWIQLGDAYFHDGGVAEVEEPLRRAAEALNRALALDSTLNVEPLIHLLEIAEMERDTATVRRLINRIPEDEPWSALRRLQAAAVLGDSVMLIAARQEFDSTSNGMDQLLLDAQLFGIAMQEAERSAALFLKRSRTEPSAFWRVVDDVFVFYQQLGRPVSATAAVAQLGPKEAIPTLVRRERAVRFLLGDIIVHTIYGYYGDADTTAGVEALAHLGPYADGPVARDSAARKQQYEAICPVEWWRLAHGNTRTARSAIARLAGGHAWGCGLLLEALLAAVQHRPDAGAAFGRLDSLLRAGGGVPGWAMEVARWREGQGDLQGALRATRLVPRYFPILNLSYALREQGRLAALVGDRAGAIKAYSHYLALRYNPEPAVKPEVDRVRAELAQLVGEPR
jgi:tetratricopeptide (TPR) repeat protein